MSSKHSAGTHNEETTHRRRFLQSIGALSVAGVAGCLGDDDDADDSADADDTDDDDIDDDDPTAGGYFEVSDLSPTEPEIPQGEELEATATILNSGGERDAQRIELRIDDTVLDETIITLDPDEDNTISLAGTIDEAFSEGEYVYGMYSEDEGTEGTLTVLEVDSILDYNPYDGVDWETDEPYKNQVHAHTRGAYDELADLIRTYSGEGPDPQGEYLVDGDEYHFPNPSYGTGPTCHYWPWDNLSACGAWDEDYDAEASGTVGYPIVEIDDIWHTNTVFNYALPNDANDDLPEYSDWEELVGVALDNEEFTVVDGEITTPYVMPAHPMRYYNDPTTDGLSSYRGPFEEYSLEDGLIGLEVLEKEWDAFRQGDPRWNNVILAGLLTDLDDREGPCLMFGADDPNSHEIGHDMDRRWTELVLAPDDFDPSDQPSSRRAAYDAMGAGRAFACQRVPWDHSSEDPPQVPTINAVEVDELANTITVDADGGIVYWINAHIAAGGDEQEYLESAVTVGDTFDYDEYEAVVEGSHIIPHVVTEDLTGETLLQPFTFAGTRPPEDVDIELEGQESGWVGVAPDEIAGEENPTLTLQAGREYTLLWTNTDGGFHDFVIADADGDVVVESEGTSELNGWEVVEFTAEEGMETYYCAPHQGTMVGEIEIDEGVEVGEVIEDFERDDPLDAYYGNTGDFSIVTDPVFEGNQALRGDTGPDTMTSVDGLSNYPEAGDSFCVHWLFTNDGAVPNFHFGVDGEQDDRIDLYDVGLSTRDSELELRVYEGGSSETLFASNEPIPENEWLRMEVHWGDDGEIEINVFDEDDDVVVSGSAVDDIYTEGGIGFRSSGNNSVWDLVAFLE